MRRSWLHATALLVLACGGNERRPGLAFTPDPAPDLGAVVARVGTHAIYAGEVRAQAARDGLAPRAALDRLVAFLLLAERARTRPAAQTGGAGLASPPAANPLLVQRLLERDFEPRTRIEDIPQHELRGAYESVKMHYVHPRMVEVGLLSVYTGPGMKPEGRARAEATARALVQHMRRNPPASFEAFAAIASDPAWVARKVRYQRTWQGPSRAFGNFGGKVAPAIQQLSRPGQMSPLIEDDSGYHIAWYLAEDPARNVPFEAAGDELRRQFHPVWRQRRFDELARQVAAEHAVEIYRERVMAVRPRP